MYIQILYIFKNFWNLDSSANILILTNLQPD